MRQEVIDFYLSKKQIIHRIMDRRPKKEISEFYVKRGMERVYDRIQAGEKIPDIRVTHEAWTEAARLFDEKWIETDQARATIPSPTNALDARKVINALERRNIDTEILTYNQHELEIACFHEHITGLDDEGCKEHDRAEFYKTLLINLALLSGYGLLVFIIRSIQ